MKKITYKYPVEIKIKAWCEVSSKKIFRKGRIISHLEDVYWLHNVFSNKSDAEAYHKKYRHKTTPSKIVQCEITYLKP